MVNMIIAGRVHIRTIAISFEHIVDNIVVTTPWRSNFIVIRIIQIHSISTCNYIITHHVHICRIKRVQAIGRGVTEVFKSISFNVDVLNVVESSTIGILLTEDVVFYHKVFIKVC